jgi:pimeloyl-ACP methyl ester carboxylesterase
MSLTRARNIESDGTVFHYRETGARSRPTLVALHALGEDARDWDEMAQSLSDRYRVLALDQRGHGQGEYTDEYSFELMRDDLRAFVDALGLERFSLMGHSMGGLVALVFAQEYPERVHRLVLEDMAPPRQGGQRPEPPKEPPEPVPFDWRVVAPIRRQLNEPDSAWWGRLPEITAPTLVVGGGSTSHIPQEDLEALSGRVPGCRLVTIEGAGHQVHSARHEQFLAAINEFLASK